MVRVGLGWVEGFFWPNPKVRVGWISNPTQLENFHNPTQANLYFQVGFELGCPIVKKNYFYKKLFIYNL